MIPPDADKILEAAITRVAAALADGFDPTEDLAVLVREAVEIAETFGDLAGSEKKALALAFLERVIDECWASATPTIDAIVEELDLPGPEWVEQVVWDPLLQAIAPQLIRPAVLRLLPRIVDLVVDASREHLDINRRT